MSEKETTTRERSEQIEETQLSEKAQFATESKGRQVEIEPCPLRTCYQRDRDRIIHSKAFRRLTHKTQVFLAPEGDHYRTRLTHTLEVSQISRTIARALCFNEDLTEAIALGHDLGHTPFGHVGEEALRDTGKHEKPFRHNEQSLRVVDIIEYEGKGLNLTWEVRDGILNHTGKNMSATLEGRIVRIADRIAYINHDIDDAVRGGIIKESDLPAQPVEFFGHHHGLRISAMVKDLISASANQPDIKMSPQGWRLMNQLRSFLFESVYTDSVAKTEDAKAGFILRSLFDYYCLHSDELPPEFHPLSADDVTIKVVDYVAGMTDRFAIKTYQALFIPKAWMV
ncbi:MAG TPA: deoxyguanosinetriphosphate triphosphohydrolase [Actinobacteria bacterium]|nr:deoxyguanosinetriphosphate triphosphohydrolase [Actinomycetota bacterium]